MSSAAQEPGADSEPASDADRDPADVARVVEIVAAEGDWETVIDGALLLLSLGRMHRADERQQEVDN